MSLPPGARGPRAPSRAVSARSRAAVRSRHRSAEAGRARTRTKAARATCTRARRLPVCPVGHVDRVHEVVRCRLAAPLAAARQPAAGGKGVPPHTAETRRCNAHVCPVDCKDRYLRSVERMQHDVWRWSSAPLAHQRAAVTVVRLARTALKRKHARMAHARSTAPLVHSALGALAALLATMACSPAAAPSPRGLATVATCPYLEETRPACPHATLTASGPDGLGDVQQVLRSRQAIPPCCVSLSCSAPTASTVLPTMCATATSTLARWTARLAVGMHGARALRAVAVVRRSATVPTPSRKRRPRLPARQGGAHVQLSHKCAQDGYVGTWGTWSTCTCQLLARRSAHAPASSPAMAARHVRTLMRRAFATAMPARSTVRSVLSPAGRRARCLAVSATRAARRCAAAKRRPCVPAHVGDHSCTNGPSYLLHRQWLQRMVRVPVV